MSSETTNPVNKEEEDMRQQKKVMRKEVRASVKALSRQEILDQSQKVWDKLVELPLYQKAQTVGLFLSMPKNEICTESICRQCTKDGKDVYVPKVGIDFEHADMELLKVVTSPKEDEAKNENDKGESSLFYEDWPRNKWGIPEPPDSMPIEIAQPGDIDLLVMPGLAFDHDGNRLGQGKGYYDRFIARMSVKPLNLVAVCLDCQLFKSTSIPVHDYDQAMHMILSPSETVTIKTLGEDSQDDSKKRSASDAEKDAPEKKAKA